MVNESATKDLLDKVLNTKVQRKAKAVIMTCVQFILTNTFILMNVADEAKAQHHSVGTGLNVMIYIAIAYAVGVSIFLLIHALCLGNADYETNLEIEEAYEKTNSTPLFDGILEIPLAIRFKGHLWWLIWIFWGLFTGIGGTFVALIYILPDFDTSNATSVAVGAAVFELYEITSDFSEYWIYTRHSKRNQYVSIPSVDDA